MGEAGGRFDPTPHLRQLKGRGGQAQDYLDVRWRLLWLRREHPDATIETDHVEITEARAVFRAVVALPVGGKATGYGSETPGDFADYIEKAETKAIGRALNALGYGAQFADREDVDPSGPMQPDTNRGLHAAAEERGLRHASLSFVAGAWAGTDSMAKLTEEQGRRLLRFLERMGPDEAADLLAIVGAGSPEELADLSRAIAARPRGPAAELIVTAGQRKKAELEAPSSGTGPGAAGSQPALIPADPAAMLARINNAGTQADLQAVHADLTAAGAGRELWDAYGRKAKAISTTG